MNEWYPQSCLGNRRMFWWGTGSMRIKDVPLLSTSAECLLGPTQSFLSVDPKPFILGLLVTVSTVWT